MNQRNQLTPLYKPYYGKFYMRYEFLSKEAFDQKNVQEMLEEEFLHWIQLKSRRKYALILAGYENTELQALLVVDHVPHSSTAHIQSLKTKSLDAIPSLFSTMESHLASRGVIKLTGEFQGADALYPILKGEGWSPFIPLFECFLFDLRHFNPPWYAAPPPLPPAYQIFPWSILSPEEAAGLEALGESGQALISDHDRNFPIEKLNSLILKKEGVIAGWMETHRLDENTIVYSHLFLFPKYRYEGAAIPLLAKSIYIQALTPHPFAFFELNLQSTPLPWQNFIAKRLRPYALKSYITSYSYKLINVL
jgi:hypothetical protein